MDKKNIFIWTLYDFANSVVEVVFFLYFAQWLVVDNGFSDFWYNMTFSIGSLMLLFSAPILGSIADKTGKQHSYLNKITILTFLSFAGAAIITLFFSNQVVLAALFFLLANYFYQFSFVFYNALLHHIAPTERQGLISGVGQAGNWVGQIVGLLISLPLAGGTIYIIGEAGKAQAFLPVAVIFLLLSLPMIFKFKVKVPIEEPIEKISLRDEYKSYWRKTKELLRLPNLGVFLLAYFFFNDAIITALNNFPIYLDQVFNMPDRTKSLVLICILVTSAIGALISGWISDRIGLKKSLYAVLGCWVVFFPIFALVHDMNVFIIVCVVSGFLFGGIWTVSRAAMTLLCPKDKLNFGFSFYTMAERVSTLIGPLSWGLITSLLVHLGPLRYRLAIGAMAVFVFIGILILRKVNFQKVAID